MLATLSLVVRYMPLQEGGRPYIRKKKATPGSGILRRGGVLSHIIFDFQKSVYLNS